MSAIALGGASLGLAFEVDFRDGAIAARSLGLVQSAVASLDHRFGAWSFADRCVFAGCVVFALALAAPQARTKKPDATNSPVAMRRFSYTGAAAPGSPGSDGRRVARTGAGIRAAPTTTRPNARSRPLSACRRTVKKHASCGRHASCVMKSAV